MISLIITIATLTISAYTDISYRKVFNCIVFPAIVAGLLFCGFPFSSESYYRLFWIMIFFFLGSFRMMGMGDLKLCMAVIALRGIEEASLMLIFGAFLLLLYCFLTDRKNTVLTLRDTFYAFLYQTKIIKRSDKKYPFAVFLAMGYVIAKMTRSCFF